MNQTDRHSDFFKKYCGIAGMTGEEADELWNEVEVVALAQTLSEWLGTAITDQAEKDRINNALAEVQTQKNADVFYDHLKTLGDSEQKSYFQIYGKNIVAVLEKAMQFIKKEMSMDQKQVLGAFMKSV